MSKINSLTNGGYIIYNKDIAKRFGINEAILLGEFVQEHNYWDDHGALKDGWFFSTVENVESATGLGRRRQESAVKTLVNNGLIKIEHRGMPPKRYVKIEKIF